MEITPVTCAQALQDAHRRGVSRLDAQLLLLHILQRPDRDRAWLLAHDEVLLTPPQTTAYSRLLQRRTNSEPVAYLVGHKDFYGLELLVDARVLVPRPDTETLVAWALETLARGLGHHRATVLDLGTGSGAVALAIAHSLQGSEHPPRVVGVDASADALAVAQMNADRLRMDVSLLHSNWFERVTGCFDLIVSNPPYIAEADPHLLALVHEPRQALTAGFDGLNDIRHIIHHATGFLHPNGWLLLEHGYDQAEKVRGLLACAGFVTVASRKDLAGIDRCSGGRWPGGQPVRTAG